MNKNKLLIGLGTISAAAMPALAVISCGSEDKAVTHLTGEQFVSAVTVEKLETFLGGMAKNGKDSVKDGSFEIKDEITKEIYDIAATATGHKDLFDDVLSLNKNNVKLAIHVINFTYKTISGIQLAYMGINGYVFGGDNSDPAIVSRIATANKEIKGGILSAKVIADGVMFKFTNTNKDSTSALTNVSADTTWGPMIFMTYVNENGTLVEQSKEMVSTMGGVESVKDIVVSSGYHYRVKAAR